MKNISKKIWAIILSIAILIGVMQFGTINTIAETLSEAEFAQKIAYLKGVYRDKEYWNNYNSCGYDGTGPLKCNCSPACSANCSCQCGKFYLNGNYYGGQCFGFANKMAYLCFGSIPTVNWSQYSSVNEYYAGDYVRIRNDHHSIFITAVSGNTVTYVDCNNYGPCQVKWDRTISISSLKSITTYVYHLSGNTLKGSGGGDIPPDPIKPTEDIIHWANSGVTSSGFSVYFKFANCAQVVIKIKSIALNTTVGELTVSNDYTYNFGVGDSSWGSEFEVRLIPDGHDERTHYLRYGDKDNRVILPTTPSVPEEIIHGGSDQAEHELTPDVILHIDSPTKYYDGSDDILVSVWVASRNREISSCMAQWTNDKNRGMQYNLTPSGKAAQDVRDVYPNYAYCIRFSTVIDRMDLDSNAKYKFTFWIALSDNTGSTAGLIETEFTVGNVQCPHRNTLKLVNQKAATCTATGYTGDYVCTHCNEMVTVGSVIEPIGHKYLNTVIEPTESSEGYTLHECKLCDYSYTSDIVDRIRALGDVDFDYDVDEDDVKIVLDYDNGTYTLTDEQIAYADVNKDGVVNAGDAVLILRFISGKIDYFN